MYQWDGLYTRKVIDGGREEIRPVNYPSNSRKSKEQKDPKPVPPERKIEPVVTGKVIMKKKGFGKKFRESFFDERGVQGAVDDAIQDGLISAFKGMIWDSVGQVANAILDGFSRALWGTTRRPFQQGTTSTYNYSRVQVRGGQPAYQYNTVTPRARQFHDFSNVIIQSRAEAEEVLDGLRAAIDQYQFVSVADFYALLGQTADYPDRDWGWDNLQSAIVRPVRHGYLIDLPQPQQYE